jgi:PTS system fructose-specific IIA component
MSVLDIFDKRVVDLNMDVKNKDEAIRLMASHLKDAGYIADVEEFVADIYLREKEGCTGIGEGIAIPHGKSDSVKNIGIAVGKCRHPIDWETLDGKPVEVIFLFCVSKSRYNTDHLKLLGDLAGRLGSGNTIANLKKMKTYDELLQAFQDNSSAPVNDMEEMTDDIEIKIQ